MKSVQDIFGCGDLPRYYVEHFPPMLYEEHDLDAFDSLEEAEDFAEDCVRGGENARIFGEMARLDAASLRPALREDAACAELDAPDGYGLTAPEEPVGPGVPYGWPLAA